MKLEKNERDEMCKETLYMKGQESNRRESMNLKIVVHHKIFIRKVSFLFHVKWNSTRKKEKALKHFFKFM